MLRLLTRVPGYEKLSASPREVLDLLIQPYHTSRHGGITSSVTISTISDQCGCRRTPTTGYDPHRPRKLHQAAENNEHVHHLNFRVMNEGTGPRAHIGCREERVVRLHREGFAKPAAHPESRGHRPEPATHRTQSLRPRQRHRRAERRTVLRLSRLPQAFFGWANASRVAFFGLLYLPPPYRRRRCGYANTLGCLRRRNRFSTLSTEAFGTALSSSSGRSSPGCGSFSLCRLYAGHRRGTRLTCLISGALVLAHLPSAGPTARVNLCVQGCTAAR